MINNSDKNNINDDLTDDVTNNNDNEIETKNTCLNITDEEKIGNIEGDKEDNKEDKKEDKKEEVSASQNYFDWLQSIVTALIVVTILLTFFCRLVDVSGTSMENTLLNKDKVLVSNLFYEPHVNDIVIISHAEYYEKPIVKRVIAVENQTVDIDFEKGIVYVDGIEIDEPYIKNLTTRQGDVEFPVTVKEGCVFVMGDNRSVSNDSRYKEIGQIEVSNIIGKAQFIVTPFSRFKYLY